MKWNKSALVVLFLLGGCAISTQQEIQMGQQDAAQINSQLPIISDREVNAYINTLGDSIAKLTSRGDLPWHFYVVDSPEINAFALPGGFVYVNRGLIEKAQRMDQLAGAMGHEIGHVVMRHSVKQLQKMNDAQIGVTLMCVLTAVCNSGLAQAGVNVGGNLVFAKFSRDDEAQADEVGVQNVVRAGIDPRGLTEMFQILINERTSEPGTVDAWFATHPTEESRIADVNARIAKIPAPILRTLTRDTPEFHSFQARVRALPHLH